MKTNRNSLLLVFSYFSSAGMFWLVHYIVYVFVIGQIDYSADFTKLNWKLLEKPVWFKHIAFLFESQTFTFERSKAPEILSSIQLKQPATWVQDLV